MITLPPPYHLIQTTLDMEMNARQRRAARRRAEREAEAYEEAMHAQQIEASAIGGATDALEIIYKGLAYSVVTLVVAVLSVIGLLVWIFG